MKKIFSFLLVLASMAFSATWYNSTITQGIPKVVDAPPVSVLMADVKLSLSDTVYSTALDLYKIPFLAGDSLGQTFRLDTSSMSFGTVSVSCYDVSDSAAIVDSVIVTTTIQESQFAGDGINPLSPFSAAWDSVTAVTLASASDANALVNGVARPAFKTRDHRYLRARLINKSSTGAYYGKNVPRCRVYYVRKAFTR